VRRHVLTVAAVVGLLVWVVAGWLCYTSWARRETVYLRRMDASFTRRDVGCWVDWSGVVVRAFRPAPRQIIFQWDPQTSRFTGYDQLRAGAPTTRLEFWGLEFSRNVPYATIASGQATLEGYTTETIVPWWLVFAAAGTPPLWWLLTLPRLLRRRRRERGLCERCGYDLRGSKEAGRCPECGTPMAGPSAPPTVAALADGARPA
jgi:hypothetical protein